MGFYYISIFSLVPFRIACGVLAGARCAGAEIASGQRGLGVPHRTHVARCVETA